MTAKRIVASAQQTTQEAYHVLSGYAAPHRVLRIMENGYWCEGPERSSVSNVVMSASLTAENIASPQSLLMALLNSKIKVERDHDHGDFFASIGDEHFGEVFSDTEHGAREQMLSALLKPIST